MTLPPQHSRSRPPESPLGVARVGRGVLFRGPNVRSGSYSRTWRFFLRSFLVQSTGQFRSSALVTCCSAALSPVILRLVTLLGGTTYTTPQVAAAVSGPVTTAVRGLVRRSRYLLC